MALYDNYFTNEDKPFAENLNDALLLSNVFDMTVNVEAPKMFSNKTWVNTTSLRKCSVSILTLKEGLPSGVSVGTDSETGNSTLTGTGTVKLSWYPNFNSFGKFKSISWEAEGDITVNLKTSNGTTIASNIDKGIIENQSSELRILQEIVIELVFNNATLKSLTVTMENKSQNRYGATVGITDVTGLDDTITTIQGKDTEQDERLTTLEGTVNELFDLIYPVGSIYMSVNSTSPAILFGGTWQKIEDTFLLASGLTYSNGATGGEATHTLTTNEMPSHTHTQNSHTHNPSSIGRNWVPNTQSLSRSRFSTSSSGDKYLIASDSMNDWVWGETGSTTATNKNTGGGQAHNNMPPYLVVNVWKRTA